MEGITNDQAHQLAEEALAKARIDNQIRFNNTLYLINAEIKTSAEKGYKVLNKSYKVSDKTLPGYQVEYVEIDRLMDNLKKRGFKVKVEYEVDGAPHWNLTISWDKPNNKKVQTKTWVNLMILLIALTLIFYFIKIMVW